MSRLTLQSQPPVGHEHSRRSAPGARRNSPSASRCRAARTRCWCAAKAAIPTISTCPARPMRRSCAARTPTASCARSTPRRRAGCRACSRSIPAPIFAAGYGSLRCRRRSRTATAPPMLKPARPALATDKRALRRRPGRLRHRRDGGAGEGRGRSGDPRHRAAAGGDRRRSAALEAGAPQLYDDVPGNVIARLPFRRHRQGARRHSPAPRMSPGCALATTG